MLIFFLSSPSHSEVVKKVEVVGNERVSLETIMIFGDIKRGDNYERDDVNEIIKKLYDTTFFADIKTELKNGVLTIYVKENPIVNLIIFEGEKAKKYQDAIIENLSLREKTSFVRNSVKKDINLIRNFYRSLGYYFVEIEAEVQQLDKNRVNLIYSIERGEKAKIAKIFFLGDKKLRDGKLRNIITSEEARFWKFISKTVYLNESRIELDKRLLKKHYQNKGYYEVHISSSNVEYAEGEGFVLTYNIEAGKRYKFKKIFLSVEQELDKTPFFRLDKEFRKVVGEYYSKRKLKLLLDEIDNITQLKELQFVNHSLTETLDESDNTISVEINVFEGPKFFVERVDIMGNNVTNDAVIRSELITDEGDPYSPLLINKSVNNIRARGIFSKVDKKILPGSSSDLKILQIEVEEQATGEISAGAGVGTEGTTLAFMVKENNWLGRGIKLDSSLDITEETIRGGISVENPNYNFTGNSVRGSLESKKTDQSKTSGFESTKTGFTLGTSFEHRQNLFLSPEIQSSYEDVSVDSSASSAIKKMAGTYTNFDFLYGVILDKRNQTFQPTDGYRFQFIQKLPLFSDSPDILNGLNLSNYHAFSDNIIAAVKFYARSIHSLSDSEDVRLTSRLFLPSRNLRGFQTKRVGPKDSEDHIGGNYATAINLEANLPNLLPEATRTDISAFIDAGNVWGVDYDSSIDDTNKLRTSAGIAANVFTPVGPLSLIFAVPITKASSDKTQVFNFRLGTSF